MEGQEQDSVHVTGRRKWNWKPIWQALWLDLATGVKVLVVALITLGLLLTVFGVIQDLSNGSWANLPFSVNMVSSIASACFGIPLALVILRYLVNDQEATRALRLARATADEMRQMADRYVLDQDAYARAVTDLSSGRKRLREVESRISDISRAPGMQDFEDYAQVLGEVLAACELLQAAIAPWPRTHVLPDLIRSRWRYLDEDVRPRLLEMDLHYLGDRTAIRAQRTLPDPVEGILPGAHLLHARRLMSEARKAAMEGTSRWKAISVAKVENEIDLFDQCARGISELQEVTRAVAREIGVSQLIRLDY